MNNDKVVALLRQAQTTIDDLQKAIAYLTGVVTERRQGFYDPPAPAKEQLSETAKALIKALNADETPYALDNHDLPMKQARTLLQVPGRPIYETPAKSPGSQLKVSPPEPAVPLDESQLSAAKAVADGKNVFITGPGGVGKGAVVNHALALLRHEGKKVRSAASTGIAAVANGGTTIHSLLGTNIISNVEDVKDYAGTIALHRARERLVGECDCIIVDEVSMLHGDYIEMMNWWLQQVFRNKDEPFGGVQIVFVGDMLQLAPVIRDEDEVKYKYAFQAPAWKELAMKSFHLQKSYRASNAELVRHLNNVRMGNVTPETVAYFSATKKHKLDDPTIIFPTNAEADDMNRQRLNAWPGASCRYEALYDGGTDKDQKRLSTIIPTDEMLTLKVGAPILMVKNTTDFVNGQRGKVMELSNDRIVVDLDGRRVDVQRHEWELKDGDENVISTCHHFPIKLAWGMTCHRSQGLTLSLVKCYMEKVFGTGMAYVALSRVTSYEGLCVADKFTPESVKTSKICKKFYETLT